MSSENEIFLWESSCTWWYSQEVKYNEKLAFGDEALIFDNSLSQLLDNGWLFLINFDHLAENIRKSH